MNHSPLLPTLLIAALSASPPAALTQNPVAAPATTTANPADPKPNVVFILADDLGWQGIGSFGNTLVPTPNLDRLAANGMKFTRAYVTPQCTPTRASLITGQYTSRHRMWHVTGGYHYPHMRLREPEYLENLPRTTPTLPKTLRQHGYTTAHIGKWHLHNWTDGHYDLLFDPHADAYGYDYVRPRYDERNRISGNRSPDKGVTDSTDDAIAFIRTPRDKPYYLHLAYHTVHGPYRAPQPIVQKYLDQNHPAQPRALNSALYLAMIEHMDQQIGRLMQAIEDAGQLQRTMIIFLSDNGGIHTTFSNGPLRLGKGTPYEGGVRVPMIVTWPGTIPSGQTSDEPVHAVDFYPTLLAAGGAAPPTKHILDGVNLMPLFRGEQTTLSRDALYFYQPLYDDGFATVPSASIIAGDWKLIDFYGNYCDAENNRTYTPSGRLELFNLKTDPGERNNLAEREPEKLRELHGKLYTWLRDTQAPMPSFNPDYDATKLWRRAAGQWSPHQPATATTSPAAGATAD